MFISAGFFSLRRIIRNDNREPFGNGVTCPCGESWLVSIENKKSNEKYMKKERKARESSSISFCVLWRSAGLEREFETF